MKVSKQSLAQAAQIKRYLNELADGGYGDDCRRLDANETNMLALQLEQMRTRVYEDEYPELKARQILPVESDIDSGAETFAYEEYSEVGQAVVLASDYSDDPKTVETSSRKTSNGIIALGDAYAWSIQDLRRAAFAGKPLPERKAKAARRIWERGLDKVAARGNAAHGIPDFLGRAVGSSAGQLPGAAATSADWAAGTATAATMVASANAAVAAMITGSKEVYEPDTLVLPTHLYLRFHQTYTTDGSPEAAAERFLKSNGFVKNIIPWNELTGVDGGGANQSRALLMKKDPEILSLVIPQEFEVLPPQPHAFRFKVFCHGRTAGTCVYRPLGVRFMTAMPSA